MKPHYKKYAPISLYITLAALVLSIGYYIVTRKFDLPIQISTGFVILGLAGFALMEPQKIKQLFTGRQARYGSNALIMTIAFIGILTVINILVFNNSKRWDLTEDKERSLAPETLDILNSLPEPVTAQAFFTSYYPSEPAKQLLDSFAYNSNGNFVYEFIDPEKNPIAAQNAGITRDGTIVLYLGEHQELVSFASEKELAVTLIRLLSPEERNILFLTGHGEVGFDSTAEISFSELKRTLESKNYQVGNLSLLNNSIIPENTLAIVIGGAKKPIDEKEIEIIDQYLAGGGSLVVLSDPIFLSGIQEVSDMLSQYLLNTWNVKLNNDLIIDPNINPSIVAVADVNTYVNHPITSKMAGLATIFPTSQSISLLVSENIIQTSLISTYENTWGETDIASIDNNSVSFDPSSDFAGPLSAAVVVNNSDSGARLAIFGDYDFVTDNYFYNYGNGDLIINTIDWAAEQEDLINLTPKDQTTRLLQTPTQTTLGLLFLISVLIIPGAVVFAGINTWARRRRKG